MLLSKKIIILFFIFSLPACVSANQFILLSDKDAIRILDSAMKPDTLADNQAKWNAINALAENDVDKIEIIVELLDYYIGDASIGEIDELITKKGKVALPYLKNKLSLPLQCITKYRDICVKNISSRNKRIKMLIDSIEKGVVLNTAD